MGPIRDLTAVEQKFTHIWGDLFSLLHAEPTQKVEWFSVSVQEERETQPSKTVGNSTLLLKEITVGDAVGCLSNSPFPLLSSCPSLSA